MFLKWLLDYLLKLLRTILKVDTETSWPLVTIIVVAAILEVFVLTAFVVMLIVSRMYLGL
jgi:hypothetical protein